MELLKNPTHVTPSTGSGRALNEVKGLLALVESSSRRFFAEFTLSAGRRLFASLRVTASEGLRMTRGGLLQQPQIPQMNADCTRCHPDVEEGSRLASGTGHSQLRAAMDARPKALRRTSAEASQRVSSRARDRAPAKAPYVAVGTTPLFSDCTDACIAPDIAKRTLAVVTASPSV